MDDSPVDNVGMTIDMSLHIDIAYISLYRIVLIDYHKFQ
jgi:hypothetical protein